MGDDGWAGCCGGGGGGGLWDDGGWMDGSVLVMVVVGVMVVVLQVAGRLSTDAAAVMLGMCCLPPISHAVVVVSQLFNIHYPFVSLIYIVSILSRFINFVFPHTQQQHTHQLDTDETSKDSRALTPGWGWMDGYCRYEAHTHTPAHRRACMVQLEP